MSAVRRWYCDQIFSQLPIRQYLTNPKAQEMSKPLSPKSAGFLGAMLTLVGAGGILGALPQQSNGGVAALIVVSTCFLVLGT